MNCPQCGKEFSPSSVHQKYCSVVCDDIARKSRLEELSKRGTVNADTKPPRRTLRAALEVRKCAYCGNEFKPYQSNQKFCCHSCDVDFHNYKNRRLEETRLCEYCGREYKPIRQRQKFCCSKCRNASGNRQRYIPKVKIVACLECGKEFESHFNQGYCSKECRRESDRKKKELYRSKHPQAEREKQRRYYAAHREEVLAKHKAKRLERKIQRENLSDL